MNKLKPLSAFSRFELRQALKRGSLTLYLGPFAHMIKGASDPLLDYLQDTYRDTLVELTPSDVTDIHLNLSAPNFLRRFIRRQVTPDPGFDVPVAPLPLSMAPLAFEMGLNLSVALKCCRFVTVHAGVVADEDGAIMMSGASGSGKSTLTAALMAEGYRLFSDEFALVGLSDRLLHPYPRPISMKQETIPVIADLVGEEFISPVISGTPKGDIAYRRARNSDIQAAQTPAKPQMILFPRFSQGEASQVQPLNTAEAIMNLIPASTNYTLLGEPAFHAMLEMVQNVPAYEISYGSLEQSVEIVADLKKRGRS
jgi:HprK-related kinase A